MEWARLVLVTTVVAGCLMECANAENVCTSKDKYGKTCVELFCADIPERFKNLSSEIEQLATKFGTLHENPSSKTRTDARLIRIDRNTETTASKISALEARMDEKFSTLSQKYEALEKSVAEIGKMLKAVLETQKLEQHENSTKEGLEQQGEVPTDDSTPINMEGFATTERYTNARLYTNLTDYFPQQVFPKDMSAERAAYKCKVNCAKIDNCKAFNLIAEQDGFVCEMLPDNLCFNQTRNALLNWPESTLWEKTLPSTQKTCLDEKFPLGEPIPCASIRPGCLGNWPGCSKCSQTCKGVSSFRKFTFWPEGDGPFGTPIFGLCDSSSVVLIQRKVDLQTGRLVDNYFMSFDDMNRMSQLRLHKFMKFVFNNRWLGYSNPRIDVDGTLSNLVFEPTKSEVADIFNLKGATLPPTPFVTVTDDRHGCGSFWLLDPKNAYCPGGQVSMLGEVKMKGRRVISTGMSLPELYKENETVYFARILLAHV